MSQESDGYEAFIAELIGNLRASNRDISDLGHGRQNTVTGASGQPHQIDVSFIDHDFEPPKLVLIECKRRGKPIDLEHVKVVLATLFDVLVSKEPLLDVGAIIVSTNGAREGARRFAEHYGIVLEVTEHGGTYAFRYKNIVQCGFGETLRMADKASITVKRACSVCKEPFELEDGCQVICPSCN